MKKLLYTIITLIAFFIAGPLYAATWYAQNGSGAMSTRTWNDAAGGGGSALTWNNQATGDIFEANGQTAIAIDVDPKGTGAATKVHLKTTAGGGFTYATTASPPATVSVDATAGTTPVIVTSGNNAGTGFVIGIAGSVFTGGGTANATAITGGHTVGTVGVVGNSVGGGISSGYGVTFGGASGAMTVTGNCTGVTGPACRTNSTGTMTVNGNCVGSDVANIAGCTAESTGAITNTGNIIYGARGAGAIGTITWAPATAKNYIQFTVGTDVFASAGLASDSAGTQITEANTAAQIKTGAYFVGKSTYDGSTLTQGSATSGGGGAWGF